MTGEAGGRRIAAAARTDVGEVRSQNEDAGLVRPDAGLFVVADGMGGHAAGEVASALAVEAVAERLAGTATGVGDADAEGRAEEPGGVPGSLVAERGSLSGTGTPWAGEGAPWQDLRQAREAVREAVEAANRRIHRQARENPAQSGMGTTATVLLLPGSDRWIVGQVGDSRAYLLRGGELSRVTTDHTIVPGSSTLTRALGTRADVEVDVLDGELRLGDLFLLCSDGLTDMVAHDDIQDLLAASAGEPGDAGDGVGGREGGGDRTGQPTAPQGAAESLVDEVLDRGAHDNVTVIVVGVREG